MMFVEFKDVYKTYHMGEIKITASDGVSFSIGEGEFALIVGASGAGKTTVLNILGGIDTADSGSVLVDGKDVLKMNRKELIQYRRHDIGFVFQFYNLMPNLTALENIELATQVTPKALDPLQTLSNVGLADRMSNFPSQLSGGEQQRVSIARALAKNPKLLLCDEPTGALDYNTGKSILQLLHETCRQMKKTVVLITHNSMIKPIADRIITMKNSKVEEIYINSNPVSVNDVEW
ncbi:MAG: ABC transporter ATP-binding protein [Eubacteriaceae bacterium]|nr:ABC transporter ATP-binding protein [Eubacteriaceae bacterium]